MTLAELKRNAKKGNMVLELMERFGKTGDAYRIQCVANAKLWERILLVLIRRKPTLAYSFLKK